MDLYGNTIGPEGIKHIANALRENKTLQSIELDGNTIGLKGAKHIANTIKFFNITCTSLDTNWKVAVECTPYLNLNKKIATTISDLVEKNAALPNPLYDDIVKTIKARSVSEYYCNFFQYMGICKNIYTNDSNAEISSCPPEILYKIAEIYAEPKFESKYNITPTVCRVTLPLVLKGMEKELAQASAASR